MPYIAGFDETIAKLKQYRIKATVTDWDSDYRVVIEHGKSRVVQTCKTHHEISAFLSGYLSCVER